VYHASPGEEALSKLGTLKSRRALAVRHHGPDSPQAREAADELAAERTALYIQHLLAEAPPLPDETRAKLAELLKPAREHIKRQRLADLDSGVSAKQAAQAAARKAARQAAQLGGESA
jgi:hypothetical protein